MHNIVIITCFIILILGTSCKNKATVSANGIDSSSYIKEQNHVSSDILVKFKPGTDIETIKKIQDELGLVTVRVLNTQDLYLMKVTGKRLVKKIIDDLKEYDEVLYAEPDRKYRINDR